MPEVIFNGPEGRLEGRYHHNGADDSPIALILHPNPQQGGTMNNKLCFNMFNMFKDRGYSVMRFNFRGVGRSQGIYDQGIGELSDAASALDWMQTYNANARATWVAGYSFGSWIGMQLLMRRPEIDGFISVAAPASEYDFTFLAPCPSSGILIHGTHIKPFFTAQCDDLLRDDGGITKHISPHLSHWYTTVPTCQLIQVWARWLDGRNPRLPLEPSEPQHQPDFLSVRRLVIVMQDQGRCHGMRSWFKRTLNSALIRVPRRTYSPAISSTA